MANDCSIHAGQHNEFQRRKLDEIMGKLPENQSGGGRHKCTYCAYEQGYADGIKSAGNKLKELLDKFLVGLQ
ncbi:MAG: hypothetical protein OXG85_12330 [Chloroflexi bacterium]|nr:hypothetical protein [Chloroflexota bacterium]